MLTEQQLSNLHDMLTLNMSREELTVLIKRMTLSEVGDKETIKTLIEMLGLEYLFENDIKFLGFLNSSKVTHTNKKMTPKKKRDCFDKTQK